MMSSVTQRPRWPCFLGRFLPNLARARPYPTAGPFLCAALSAPRRAEEQRQPPVEPRQHEPHARRRDEANEPLENSELHKKIRRAIRELNPLEKKIAILRFVKEFDYNEIAERLDIQLGSVKATIYRAKESLQSALKTEYAML